MKKIIFTTIALSLVISILSCSKDNPNPVAGSNTFFAKIDGVDFNPPHVSGHNISSSNNILFTASTGTDSEQILFTMPNDIPPGTYTEFYNILVYPFIQASYSPPNSQDGDDGGDAATGTVVITEHDVDAKRIKGTFNFVTKPAENSGISWNITAGSFDITYTDL